MIEFFSKSESRGNKITRVNSIRITKSVEVRNDKGRFSERSPLV